MNVLLGTVVLSLGGVLVATLLQPRAQPPQIIYVRAEPAELKREEGAGCLPLVVLVLIVILAIGLL